MPPIPEIPEDLLGKDVTLKNGQWVLKPEQIELPKTAPSNGNGTVKLADTAQPPIKTETVKPKAVVTPKPKPVKAKPATAAPAAVAATPTQPAATAAEPKLDSETDETAEELTERAEMEATKHKAHALAAQLYRRAAKLVEGDKHKHLLTLAEKQIEQAKAKGQKETVVTQSMKTATAKKQKNQAKPAAKPTSKPKADRKASVAAKKTKAKAEKPTSPAKEGKHAPHDYPETPAQRKAAHERTLAAVAAMRKKEELSDDEKTFMKQIARGPKTLRQIGDAGWPNLNSAKRFLKAKNAKRTPVAQKLCKRVEFKVGDKSVKGYEKL